MNPIASRRRTAIAWDDFETPSIMSQSVPHSVQSLRTYRFGAVLLFFLIHAGTLAVFFVPFRISLVAWLVASYALRMFFVTAGYHRYFSHRSYKLNRFNQFVLAFLAQTSGQKGILWWAAHHREHHRHSDEDEDVHSPWAQTFWWAHVGWVLSNEYDEYNPRRIADFGKYAELRWLDRYHWLPIVCYGAAIYALGGFSAFVWGFLFSTVVLYHGTFAINSFAHLFGNRRFDTPDHSRNNWILAILTFGEGWHNNHHFSMASCRQGFRWWEIDVTYYVLRIFNCLGVARDLRPFRMPPTAGEGTPS
jgi:stearoyl-CoA desaturase (delta-9 desaturase)